ncbi:MAG: hypothetical protein KF886_12280 [Candidatus Hydrogenedentes bacterium]|nr:hypothetical protein [Candidatus Hydrogenedentota bacterium]
MPVSIHIQLTHCINKIIQLQPKSVLDVGCGFGKWGYLCREYLDVFPGRPYPDQWITRIDGIEFFEPYIMPHQRFLYSNIMIGDVRDLCKEIDHYDLIIAGDVIEHMFKDEAESVLETLYAQANKLLIVNIPLGEGWIHPEEYGNPAELHRSEWYVEDFEPFRAECAKYGLETGLQYGSFFCEKGVPDEERIAGYLFAADFHAKRGNWENASRYAHGAIALQPGNVNAICFLVDLELNRGNLPAAIGALEAGFAVNPSFVKARLYLAQLLDRAGRKEEARGHAEGLLADPKGDATLRSEAEAWMRQRGYTASA